MVALGKSTAGQGKQSNLLADALVPEYRFLSGSMGFFGRVRRAKQTNAQPASNIVESCAPEETPDTLEPFGPGSSEAARFLEQVVAQNASIDPANLVIDANVCFSSRRYPRIVTVFGKEETTISAPENAPLALMVFKMIQTKCALTAYQSKKVQGEDQQIDDNGYIWCTQGSWRVLELEKCETCAACRLKGKYLPVDDDTEPHIYTITRALDEVRETVPCILRKEGYTSRLLKHFKDLIDLALIVSEFAAMNEVSVEVTLPFARLSLLNGVLTSFSEADGADFVPRFCKIVSALMANQPTLSVSFSNSPDDILAQMYSLSTQYGTEDAYSIVTAKYVGCMWWSTQGICDEIVLNLRRLKSKTQVTDLNIDWDKVNTAELRRSWREEPPHFAGRFTGTKVSSEHFTQFGKVIVPKQPEYIQLDGHNQLEVETRDGKRALLIVNDDGALAATTRLRLHWKRFRETVRGIGVSPVSLAFDFSRLGPEDLGGSDVAYRILAGTYGDKALRFLLEMTHKGRLLVNEKSPCKSYVPKSCLSSHGVLLGSAMPARAFQNLFFGCWESDGEVDEERIVWKPTRDGNLFQLRKISMNLTVMEEIEEGVEDLKICQIMLPKDVC